MFFKQHRKKRTKKKPIKPTKKVITNSPNDAMTAFNTLPEELLADGVCKYLDVGSFLNLLATNRALKINLMNNSVILTVVNVNEEKLKFNFRHTWEYKTQYASHQSKLHLRKQFIKSDADIVSANNSLLGFDSKPNNHQLLLNTLRCKSRFMPLANAINNIRDPDQKRIAEKINKTINSRTARAKNICINVVVLLALIIAGVVNYVDRKLALVDQGTVRSLPNFNKDYFINNQTGMVMPKGFGVAYIPMVLIILLAAACGLIGGLRYCNADHRDKNAAKRIIAQNSLTNNQLIFEPPSIRGNAIKTQSMRPRRS